MDHEPHTQPMVYHLSDMPHCIGACYQGRKPCASPIACRVQLTEADRADLAAELTTDTMPLTAAEKRAALDGIKKGLATRAKQIVIAIWRAL